jgi:hypothetical protein
MDDRGSAWNGRALVIPRRSHSLQPLVGPAVEAKKPHKVNGLQPGSDEPGPTSAPALQPIDFSARPREYARNRTRNTATRIRIALQAAREAGLEVTGYDVRPDGTVTVCTTAAKREHKELKDLL